MEISGKQLAAILFAVALAFSMLGYAAKDYYVHSDPQVNVEMQIIKGEGTGAQATLYSGNLITDIGETYIGQAAILGTDANGTWSISLSNDGSSSVAWTQLPNEVVANGFTRAAGAESAAWSNGGDWAVNFTKTFTATDTQQLQTAGLNWESSGDNNLFAAADFTQTTFNADDTLTVLWIITVNAN